MSKYYGSIGYAITEETSPGIWEERIFERQYFGDIIRASRVLESSNYLNDNLNVNNSFSIVADPYAYQNFQNIRYLEWNGTKWKVRTVEVEYPRLLLTIGGVYNEG